jgi:hypothetical protein
MHLLNRDNYSSMYWLRLRDDGEQVKWVFTDKGQASCVRRGTRLALAQNLRLWLLSRLASEHLL